MATIPNGGKVAHIGGTATVTAAKTTKMATDCDHLFIANNDATNNLMISFDDGASFFSLPPGRTLDGPFSSGGQIGGRRYLWVKSSAATVAWSGLWTKVG